MSRAIALLLSAACLSACSSVDSGGRTRLSAPEGEPTRVTLVDYRSGIRMTLVNEAHSDPLELYSELRTSPDTKVVPDEAMTAMIEHFADRGFRTWAQRGYAPAVARDGELQSLELETPEETLLLVNRGGTSSAANAFRECREAFGELYAMTPQSQAIRSDQVEKLFEKKRPNEKRHKL